MMIEKPMFASAPERPKSEAEREAGRLIELEKQALLDWADILDVARANEIDLENALDPREANPAYKAFKEHLLRLKDDTLKILFELDNEKEKLRRKGVDIEA